MTLERNDLEALAIALANAKNAEAEAKAARVKAEDVLADALGGKDNGSSSFKVGRFGITVKRGWNYKIDDERSFAEEFPGFVKKSVKTDLLAKEYEHEREGNTELFARMAEHITATPKKVSVEVRL